MVGCEHGFRGRQAVCVRRCERDSWWAVGPSLRVYEGCEEEVARSTGSVDGHSVHQVNADSVVDTDR